MESDGRRCPAYLDPEFFQVNAHVKNASDLATVEAQFKATAQMFADKPVDLAKLQALKQHLRYDFALQLDNSESIAATVAGLCRYSPHSGNPESLLQRVFQTDRR